MRRPNLRINTSLQLNDAQDRIKANYGKIFSYSKQSKKSTMNRNYALFLLSFLTLIVIAVIFIQFRMEEFGSLIGSSGISFDPDLAMTFTLPEKLDLETVQQDIQNLKDVIVLGKNESSPLDNCSPTVQIKLYQDKVGESASWFIQTFDETGNAKNVGGDEFYIDYTDQMNIVNDNVEPDAVALIIDLENGKYQLDFVSTPMNSKSMNPNIYSEGRIKVHFEYTCGIGMMPQPTKLNWKASGAMYQKMLYKDHFPRPKIRNFNPPHTPKLSSYSLVVFFWG